jgi:hypothetical protein
MKNQIIYGVIICIIILIVIIHINKNYQEGLQLPEKKPTYATCWSGQKQSTLGCCVSWSKNLTKEQMTERYKKDGYGQKNIGGDHWECYDTTNSGYSAYSNCNSYWNQSWLRSCSWSPVEWT